LINFLKDFFKCFLNFRYWSYFTLINIKIKYRDSIIGPFWNVISSTILVLALSFGYSSFLNLRDFKNFVYYIALGIFIWIFISNCLNEGTSILENKKNIILEKKTNIKFFIFELIFSNFIIYLHSFIVIFILLIISEIQLNFYFLLSILGLLIILINLIFWINAVMILSPVFKDIKKIVENLLLIIFFSTPIIWSEEIMRPKLKFLLNFNPFYHLISIFRDPLLNKINKQYFFHLVISLLITFCSIIISYVINKKYEKIVRLYL
jgi:ABC-type polysaccharide/polyol phosphate export permease